MKQFEIAFEQGEENVRMSKEVCEMVGHPFDLEHSRWVWLALSLVKLVKEFLDKDYLDSRIEEKNNNYNNKTGAFAKHMKKINAKKLKAYEWIRDYPDRRLEEFSPINLLKC